MAAAGLVLIASDRRMTQAAASQALPPIAALVLAAVSWCPESEGHQLT